jgi:hypothetical protein
MPPTIPRLVDVLPFRTPAHPHAPLGPLSHGPSSRRVLARLCHLWPTMSTSHHAPCRSHSLASPLLLSYRLPHLPTQSLSQPLRWPARASFRTVDSSISFCTVDLYETRLALMCHIFDLSSRGELWDVILLFPSQYHFSFFSSILSLSYSSFFIQSSQNLSLSSRPPNHSAFKVLASSSSNG